MPFKLKLTTFLCLLHELQCHVAPSRSHILATNPCTYTEILSNIGYFLLKENICGSAAISIIIVKGCTNNHSVVVDPNLSQRSNQRHPSAAPSSATRCRSAIYSTINVILCTNNNGAFIEPNGYLWVFLVREVIQWASLLRRKGGHGGPVVNEVARRTMLWCAAS